MTSFVKIMAVTLSTAAIVQSAHAQDSIFDFFGGFGSDKEEALPAPKTPTPPDETSSYFGNKVAELPTYDGDVSDLAGSWTITTERNSERCTLDGAAQIRITDSGGYTCDLVMRDYCKDTHDGIIRQSCVIGNEYDSITISATVIESLNGATLFGYSPDDFVLQPAEDGTLVGNHEGWGGYPAIWRRTIDGIS